jgi:pilus assembly protein CpaF
MSRSAPSAWPGRTRPQTASRATGERFGGDIGTTGGGESRRRLHGEIAARVLADIRVDVATRGASPGSRDLVPLVRGAAANAGWVLGLDDVLAVTALVGAELWGLGALQPLVDDPLVTDILVNAPDEVWVDGATGLRRMPCALGGEDDVRALAGRLAASAGRRLDEASPWVDARLPGGVRLHAVLPPVSPKGTVISLRILRPGQLDLPGLDAAGSVPPGWAVVLAALVRRRASFLVSGGTGAGKTTLLAALLGLVPPHERIVLVEDVGELLPRHPHVIRLEARHANVEGRGAVTLEDLVRQALRMRPDRIVVGECRGAEVRDLLAALNTGHSGGCGTVHANAATDVPARLEALGAMAGLSPGAIRVQAAAALDAVIHVSRDGAVRRIAEIAAVSRSATGDLLLLPALRDRGPDAAPAADGSPRTVLGPGWVSLAQRMGLDPTRPPSPDDLPRDLYPIRDLVAPMDVSPAQATDRVTRFNDFLRSADGAHAPNGHST